ncbi:hypothetical protein [Nonomuraea africana]|uniref:hypothetical protein n=1 Tax=Nonomuraea africana TaxID=46171 RepID=UPI001CEF2E65|nr:hypothetical protein [Nonomuraea africana]
MGRIPASRVIETVSTPTIPSRTNTTSRNGTATCTNVGAPREPSQLRTGETAITSTSASTMGPAIEATSRSPNSVTTAPAAVSRTISARGAE